MKKSDFKQNRCQTDDDFYELKILLKKLPAKNFLRRCDQFKIFFQAKILKKETSTIWVPK